MNPTGAIAVCRVTVSLSMGHRTTDGAGRRTAVRLITLIMLAALSGCATVPVAPAARVVPYDQKMAWILQLEDERLLREPIPEPAEPLPPAGRRAAPAPVAAAPAVDLALLVTDPDPRLRRRAAMAVGRVGLREGVPLLTPLLADPDADVRHAAAFALGLIGDTTAAPTLLPLLTGADPLLRGRAAEALGLMSAEDAAAAIGSMVAEYARSSTVLAMETDDERWPAPPEAEAFKLGVFALARLRAYEPLAAAVLDGAGRPVATWWPIAYALQRIEDPRAAPALTVLTTVPSRYTAAFAARGLGSAKDPAAVEALLPLLDPESRPREVVASAIRAAGQLRAAAAADRLGAIASNVRQDPNLRILAVSALGAIGATDEMPVVLDLITDEWPALRAAALRAAAAINPDHFTLILSGLEIDRHWVGRAALADALGALPPEVALTWLTSLLQDPDRRVIPHVLRALVRLKAPEVERVLVSHLQEADYVIRQTAASLVGELKPAGGLPALQEAYRDGAPDATYAARAAAIQAMAAYGEDAVESIRAALEDRDWAVRVRALDLLAKLDPSEDYRLAARPAPGVPPARYDDPAILAPPSSPHVFIDTAKGTIQFELAVLDAPQTTRNFVALVRKGFFNGLPVHRVEANFVVQDGDPRGDGTGGPGYTIRDELNERPYVRGTVGMALSWRDTGGSQFFITHSPQPHLDGRYTAFGHVVNGMDVVDRIQVGDVIQRIRVWDGERWE
jgi:cyclophilin family peptidyl-prolyl cis-trans isomerase/HEAT repeat protein